MTNNKSNYQKELDAIINGVEDSIFALSEEETNAELIDMGENPDKITEHVKNLFADADKKYKKRYLIAAQEKIKKQRSENLRKKINIITQPAEKLRAFVIDMLKAKPELQQTLTFQNRNFEDLPDEDFKSMVKHMIELELIKEEDLFNNKEEE